MSFVISLEELPRSQLLIFLLVRETHVPTDKLVPERIRLLSGDLGLVLMWLLVIRSKNTDEPPTPQRLDFLRHSLGDRYDSTPPPGPRTCLRYLGASRVLFPLYHRVSCLRHPISHPVSLLLCFSYQLSGKMTQSKPTVGLC